MAIFSYWLFPLIASVTWLGMLLAMLIAWLAQGRPRYPTMQDGQNVAFISDIGAQKLKPLFITGCAITSIGLDLALISTAWLRHKGRLVQSTRSGMIVLWLSIIFALFGGIALVLLAVYDTDEYTRLHRLFLLLFMLGYILSAIFVCWQFQRLGVRHRQLRHLRMSFWTKLAFIIIELALAIGFGVCLYRGLVEEGAVLEWVIAVIFTFYILVFILDLFPAVRKDHHHLAEIDRTEMGITGAVPAVGSTSHDQNTTITDRKSVV